MQRRAPDGALAVPQKIKRMTTKTPAVYQFGSTYLRGSPASRCNDYRWTR